VLQLANAAVQLQVILLGGNAASCSKYNDSTLKFSY
jgi:hypothetical protein